MATLSIFFCAVVLVIGVHSTKTVKSNSIIFDVTNVVKDLLQKEDEVKADEADKALKRLLAKNIKKQEPYLIYYQTNMTNNSHSEIQNVLNVFDMLNTNLSSFQPKLLLSMRDTTEQPENLKDAEYIVQNYANIINLIADHTSMVVGLSFDAVILETLCNVNGGQHESKQPVKSVVSKIHDFITSSSHPKVKKLQNILKLGYEIGMNYPECRDHIKNKNNADFVVIKISLNDKVNYFMESYGLFKENLETKMSVAVQGLENKTVLIKFNLTTLERSLHARIEERNKNNEEVYYQNEENWLTMAKGDLVDLDARTVRRYENLMIRYILREWTRQDAKGRKVVINLQGYPYFEDTDLFESWQDSPEIIPYINNFPTLKTTDATQYHDMFMKDVASTGLSTIMVPGDLWDSMYRKNESFTSCNNSDLCRPNNILYLIKNEDQFDKIIGSKLITRKNEMEVNNVVFSLDYDAPIGTDWNKVIDSIRNTYVTPVCQIETKVFKSTKNISTCNNPNACYALLILRKRVHEEFSNGKRCESMKNIPSKIIFTETIEFEELEKEFIPFNTFVNNIMKRFDSFVIAREILLKECPDKTVILQLKGLYKDDGGSSLMTLYCNDFAEKVGQFYEVILNWALIHEFPVILEPNEKKKIRYDNPLTWKQLVTHSSNLYSAMHAGPVFVRRSYNRTTVFGMWTKGMYPCLPKATMDTINTTTINFDNGYSGITLKLNLRKGNDLLSPEEIQILLLFSLGNFSTVEISLNTDDDLISLKLIFSLSHFKDHLKLNACLNKTLYLRLPKHCTKMNVKTITEIVEGFKDAGLYVNIHGPIECLNSTIVGTERGQEIENCSDLVSPAAINEMKTSHQFTELSYIICSTDEESAHNNENHIMQNYLDPHLYLKKVLQHFYPNLKRIHFRLNPKLDGSTSTEKLSNLMMYLSDVNNYAQGYNIHYFVLPAFSTENNSENQTENVSFWKINDYKELSDLSVYVDCQSELLNKKPWVPELVKDDTWMYTIVVITVLLGIVMIVAVIIWRYKFKDPENQSKVAENVAHSLDEMTSRNQYELLKSDVNIDMENILGMGQFGVVYRARLVASGDDVALKMLHDGSSESALKDMQRELKLWCSMGEHANLVRFIGCYTMEIHQGTLWIIMELCGGGSLISFLRSKRDNGMTEEFGLENLLKFSHEIACGMEYIANKNIIHGDLAARNVLLDGSGTCKIGDFGLSRQLYDYSEYVKRSHEPLPWRWMAYESLNLMEFSTKSDIWMFGITLWEIFSLGSVPYPGLAWTGSFVQELEKGLRPFCPRYATADIYEIMMRCWKLKPGERPNYADLLRQLHHLSSPYYSNQDPITHHSDNQGN